MKFFASIMKIKSVSYEAYPGDTEGDSLIATSEGQAGKGETAQIQQMPGFIGRPHSTFRGIRFRIGSIDIMIGGVTYEIDPPENEGETKIYSTDSEGAESAKINF
jgi:hypothetical protein